MLDLQRLHAAGPAPELTIKVLGLGGAGLNALDRIQLDGLEAAELIALNTDLQALAASVAPGKIQLGQQTTRGLGAGGDPELGHAAAEEAAEEIKAALEGAALVFLCVGLGGGTGSGAAPLVAHFAKQQGALVVALATLPFAFEGRRRQAQAEEALASLTQQADVVVCFENDRMGETVSPRAGIAEAFRAADETLSASVRAIAALLQRRGLIHVGFDELAAVLRAQNPRCLFGHGEAEGDHRPHAALERALRSPLLDRGRLLADAGSVLVHVAGGPSLTLNEVTVLMEELNRHISDQTRVLFSTAVDPRLGGRLAVTLLSSLGAAEAVRPGLAPRLERPAPAPAPVPVPTTLAEVEFPAVAAAAPPPEAAPAAPAAPAAEEARPAAPRPPRAAPKARPVREERQEQMQFEPVNRGRFEKSEPTIVDGQDLDVPAFMRLNLRIK